MARENANKIFVSRFTPGKQYYEIHIPAYCHVIIKRLKGICIQDMGVELYITMRVVFHIKGLPPFICRRLKSKVALVFPMNDPIILEEGININMKESKDGERI